MKGVVLAGVLLAGAPACASAQDLSLLLGGVRARYADSIAGSAGIVGGRLRFWTAKAPTDAALSVARFTSGEWAAQFAAQGGIPFPVRTAATFGVGWGASYNRLAGGVWSGAIAAGPVLARALGPVTASLGFAGGGARDIGARSFAMGSAIAGTRYAHNRFWLDGTANVTFADTMRLADWVAAIGWQGPRQEIAASAGLRSGDLHSDPWVQLRAAAAFGPVARLEMEAGSYPRDVTGFTGGRYVTVGIRLAVAAYGGRNRAPATAPLLMRRLDRSRSRLSLHMEDVRSVAIAGDWNDWSPSPMAQDSAGHWTAVIRAAPGVHRYTLLVDGGRWIVPAGAPRAPDEFDSPVGLLVVPDG